MSLWTTVLTTVVTPGVVAAGITLATNWWLQRPRPDLRMIRSYQSVDDLMRLDRAERWSTDLETHSQ